MNQEQLKKLYSLQESPIVKYEENIYKLNSKYKSGVIKLQNNYALLESSNSKVNNIHIEFSDLNGAHDGDEVIVKVIFNPKGKVKGRVIYVLTKQYKPTLSFFKNNQFYSFKESIPLNNSIKSHHLKENDVCLITHEEILETIGNLNDPTIDEKISCYLYNEIERIDKGFSHIKKEDNFELSNRTDLSHLDFCTIDPIGAKDFDDAIYFDEKSSTLYVAIADVSSYVKEGSDLDNEAKKRAFSIYLPDKVLPMLPFYLSNDLCSLRPNEKKAAYLFAMTLDIKKATVIKSELFEAFIESKQRFTYEQIDEILETKSNPYFTKLFNITSKFRNHRLKNGYDFSSQEIRLLLDDSKKLVDQKIENSSPSHSLIEECMLLANQEAAKKLHNKGIFRVHDQPSSSKMFDLIDDVNALGIKAKMKHDIHTTILSIQEKAKNKGLEKEVDDLIIKSQHQAYYSSKSLEHFGLGFDHYSHFTSPIRRYADLVLHRILKTGKVPKDIDDTCEDISNHEREIAKLVWDLEDRKYARWAYENIGNVFIGKVIDKEHQMVLLDDEKIKGVKVHLEKYHGEQLFSYLKIKIISSDIVSKKITGQIVLP